MGDNGYTSTHWGKPFQNILVTTAASVNIDATMDTVVLAGGNGGQLAVIPDPTTVPYSIFRIVSQHNGNTTSQNYINHQGISTNNLTNGGTIVIQSDGTNYYQIN